jgi:DNA repair photolyase
MTTAIYEPRGKAREYSALACNVYRGCDHACAYCYAPAATFQARQDFIHPKSRGPAFLQAVEREASALGACGNKERILLCFTCDPYQAIDRELRDTRKVLTILKRHNQRVQILTKGGMRATVDHELFTPHDAFASTLTLIDDGMTRKWEPGATLFEERCESLRFFHDRGIPTWASLEPVIDPEQTLEIISRTHPFVDLYKVGRLNYSTHAKHIDWRDFGLRAIDILESLGKDYLIKKDLQAHLSNPAP